MNRFASFATVAGVVALTSSPAFANNNVLQDGTFQVPLGTYWQSWTGTSTPITTAPNGIPGNQIALTMGTDLFQQFSGPAPGNYTLTFNAANPSSNPADLVFAIQNPGGASPNSGWYQLYQTVLAPNQSWTQETYSFTFANPAGTPSEFYFSNSYDAPVAWLGLQNSVNAPGTVIDVANVNMSPTTTVTPPPPPPPPPSTNTATTIGTFIVDAKQNSADVWAWSTVHSNVGFYENPAAIQGPLDTGIILNPNDSYTFSVPNNIWTMSASSGWSSNAGGINTLLTSPGAAQGYTTVDAINGDGTLFSADYGALIAEAGNEFFVVGTGTTVTGLSGDLKLMAWDGQYSDNSGIQTVTVSMSSPITSTDMPEPATIALLGVGLFGIGAARRRRQNSMS